MCWINQENKSREGWKIELIKTQKKKIELILDNNLSKIFNSFNECDKFLNMWRGYTSTQITNNKSVVLKYKYNLINEDIV